MTPVAIGDTQGTLQARKTCITVYKRPETLIRVYNGTTMEAHSHDNRDMRVSTEKDLKTNTALL